MSMEIDGRFESIQEDDVGQQVRRSPLPHEAVNDDRSSRTTDSTGNAGILQALKPTSASFSSSNGDVAGTAPTPPRPQSSSNDGFASLAVPPPPPAAPPPPDSSHSDRALIAQLQIQLQEEKQKRAKLNESLLRLREKVTQEVSRLESTVTEQEQTITELRDTNAALLADHDSIAALLKQKEESVSKYKREIQHACFQRDCALGDVEEVRSQVEEKQEEIEALKAAKEELEEEVKRLSERLNDAETEVERLSTLLDEERQHQQQQQSQAPPATPAPASSAVPLTSQQQQQQLPSTRPRAGSATSSFSPALTGPAMILTPEQLLIGDTKQQRSHTNARAETGGAEEEDERDNQRRQLELEIATLKAQVDALSTARDAEFDKRKTLEREVAVATAEARAYAGRVEDLQQSLEDARALKEELVAQRDGLKRQLEQAQSSSTSLPSPSTLHETCRQREAELRDRLDSLQQKLSAAESECDRLRGVVEASSAKTSADAAYGASLSPAEVTQRLREADEARAAALKDLEAATTYGRALLAANRRLQGEVSALQTTLAVRVGGSMVAGGGIVLGSAPASATTALIRSPTGRSGGSNSSGGVTGGAAPRYHRITASSVSAAAPPPSMPTMMTATTHVSSYANGLFSPSNNTLASVGTGDVVDNRSSFAFPTPAPQLQPAPLIASAGGDNTSFGSSSTSFARQQQQQQAPEPLTGSSTSVKNLLSLQMTRPAVPPRPPVGTLTPSHAAGLAPGHGSMGGSFSAPASRRNSAVGDSASFYNPAVGGAMGASDAASFQSSGPAFSRLMQSRELAAVAADRAVHHHHSQHASRSASPAATRGRGMPTTPSSSSSASSVLGMSTRFAATRTRDRDDGSGGSSSTPASGAAAIVDGEGHAAVVASDSSSAGSGNSNGTTNSVGNSSFVTAAMASQSQLLFSGVTSRMSLLAAALEAERAKRQAIEGTVAALRQQVELKKASATTTAAGSNDSTSASGGGRRRSGLSTGSAIGAMLDAVAEVDMVSAATADEPAIPMAAR